MIDGHGVRTREGLDNDMGPPERGHVSEERRGDNALGSGAISLNHLDRAVHELDGSRHQGIGHIQRDIQQEQQGEAPRRHGPHCIRSAPAGDASESSASSPSPRTAPRPLGWVSRPRSRPTRGRPRRRSSGSAGTPRAKGSPPGARDGIARTRRHRDSHDHPARRMGRPRAARGARMEAEAARGGEARSWAHGPTRDGSPTATGR